MDDSKGLISNITGWMQHPFTEQMSLFDWFLATGIVIISVVLWTRVLYLIQEIE